MRCVLLSILLFCALETSVCQQFIPLWPEGKMPNSRGMILEHKEERQRVTQVSTPGIYAFFPSNDENKGSAVLICPPGGYQKLTYVSAGFQFAKWLNTLGINAFVLFYRLPNSPDLIEREKGPIQDAQRAMKIIRANSDQWKIEDTKIGMMGASAGGHLVSTLGTHHDDFSMIGDSLDSYSFTLDFMIMISPVINMGEYTHKGSRDNFLGKDASEEMINLYSNNLHVSKKTPPAFLVHAQNDHGVSAMNSILFYESMCKAGIKGSLHIFPEGDHSIALRNNPGSTNKWTDICEAWLQEMGIINQ